MYAPPAPKKLSRIVIVVALLLLLLAGLWWVRSLARDPQFVFLAGTGEAEWIRHDRRFDLSLKPLGTNVRAFRTTFTVTEQPAEAVLSFRALKKTDILIDDEYVYKGTHPPDRWKRVRRLDLAPALQAGTHTITFVVTNENGPSALLAYSTTLGFYTGPHWDAAVDPSEWAPAVSAAYVGPSREGRALMRSDRALLRLLPVLIPLFAVVAWWRLTVLRDRAPRWLGTVTPNASALRWVLIAAWVALAANNILKIPAGFGFDVVGNMEYIHHIAQFHRLPVATDGWKMFEVPFYYAVSALPYSLIYSHLSVEENIMAMRVIPLACGILQVEVAYRTLRHIFPDRSDLQAAGTAVGALIPMNLYLSQYVGNQPLVAVLCSLALLLGFRFLRTPAPRRPHLEACAIGLVLGLALLTKLSAVLIVPPLCLLLVFGAYRRQRSGSAAWAGTLAPPLIAMGVAGVVSGWYYLRNAVLLGTLSPVGFDASLGIVWRQDPGYRTLSAFTRFGESLFYPVYAAFQSYWDSLYSTFWADGFVSSGVYPQLLPPWNFTFMLAGALLGLIPVAAMATGVVVTLARPTESLRTGSLFATIAVVAHLAGMIYLYLTLPVVSAGKAAYMLNLLPCFGILAAVGLGSLRRSAGDALYCGALACWAVCAYAAFFVL